MTMTRRDAIDDSTGSWSWLVVGAVVLAVLGTIGAGGCGQPPSGDDNCREVSCQRGVCEARTGQCINPGTCGTSMSSDAGDAPDSATPCLAGYSCVEGSCEADIACEADEDCRSGICRSGACVNPDQCERKTDCVKGHVCDADGRCVKNRCDSNSCDRGVCKPETGSCVNREACPSPEGEAPACLEGYTCYERTCTDRETLCEQLDCRRGVCSFEQTGCVNADTCSEDADCLEGRYCDNEGDGADSTCKPNQCDPDSGACDRGVCAPEAGCVNPETCSASRECLPMHECVEGSCVPSDQACGKDGCPGHQVCSYDPETLKATCQENDATSCRHAIDCVDDRVCRGGLCEAPTNCSDDAFEPNDESAEATAYHDAKTVHGGLAASICPGDTDVFTFDTARDEQFRGQLSVYLDYRPVDLGLGPVEVTIVDPEGNEVAARQTSAPAGRPGRVHVTTSVDAGSRGVYTVKVSDPGGDSMPAVSTAGLRYQLRADLVSSSLVDACSMASPLNQPQVQGDTTTGASSAMGAACVSRADEASEVIYRVELQQKSWVEFDLTPANGSVDLTASLRHACVNAGSEAACANATGTGGKESISGIYEAGTYALVVQAPRSGLGGGFTLDYTHEPVECTASDNHCLGEGAAKVCNAKGQLVQVQCDNGCSQKLGRCARPAGDLCRTAVDATGGLDGHTIDWGKLTDEFRGGSGNCLNRPDPEIDGPDAVFRTRVPAGEALWAQLQPDTGNSHRGSLYVLEGCQGNARSCLAGEDGKKPRETLTWRNDTGSRQIVFVVADSHADNAGTSRLDIQVGQTTCSPGQTTCKSGDVHVCNSAKIGYRLQHQCPAGCQMGQCSGESCAVAIDAGRGGTWTLAPENFNDDHALLTNDCVGETLDGPDAVFEVDVMADEVLEAIVDPTNQNSDPSIYITDDCGTARGHAAGCTSGADRSDRPRKETAIHHSGSSGAGTYYVVVDSEGKPGRMAKWKVDIQTHSAVCTPGTKQCGGAQNVKYCDAKGLNQKFVNCQGSNPKCVTRDGRAQCDQPTGAVCADAIPVSDGDAPTGDFTGNNNLSPNAGHLGGCYFGPSISMIGKETYYVADLKAGDLLEATLKTKSSYGRVYILGNCLSESSCLANSRGDKHVRFRATTDRKVYLVVDAHSQYRRTLKYTLDADIDSGKSCMPGQTRCSGQNTVAICNQSGTGAFDSVTCQNGCANGVCRDRHTRYDTCGQAPSIGDGIAIWGDFAELSSDVTLPADNCVGTKTEGADAWYPIDVKKGQVLTANLRSRGDDRAVLYLASDCSMPDKTCLAGNFSNQSGAPTRLQYQAKQNRTLYVGVDKQSNSAPDPFILNIGLTSNQCSAGATRCAANGKDLEYCTESGLWKTYACKGGCNQGTCQTPQGDICQDPIPLQSGDLVTGDFSGSNSLLVKKQHFGGCFLPARRKTEGADTVYTIGLSAGELLEARLQTQEHSARLMITENCAKTDACRANNPSGGSTTQFYYADKPTRVDLVVDSAGSFASGPYTLGVDVHQGRKCAPGDTRCVNNSTVGICNRAGNRYAGKSQCANGCAAGACKPHSGVNSCKSAPAITGGTVVTRDLGSLKKSVTITSKAGCVDKSGDGPDAVYSLNVTKGDRYRLRAHSPGGDETPLVYVISDCKKPNSTCKAGATGDKGRPAEVVYEADTTGTVYVVMDAERRAADEPMELHVQQLGARQCMPGARSCGPYANVFQYCSAHAERRAHRCAGGCNNGRCTHAGGDRCIEAIPMGDGDSFRGRLTDFDADHSPTAGSCGIHSAGDEPTGPEAVFSVQLKAGETLDASLETTSDDLAMYLLDQCPTKSTSASCVHGEADTDRLRFRADRANTYYLVVDTSSSRPDAPFQLDVSIDAGNACVPGATSCQSGSGDLQLCKADGSAPTGTYGCANGCRGRLCKPPKKANDTCGGAYAVQGGLHIVDKFSRFTDKLDPSSATKPCVSKAAGGEAIYEVTLDAREVVTAEAEAHDDGESPVLYILSGCTASNPTCLAGDQARRQETASTGYYNDTGSRQTVYVVVDNAGGQTTETFELDIDVRKRECDPTSGSAGSCKTANVSNTCTDLGLLEERQCYFGCDNQTGRCKQVPNDTCSGAVAINSPGAYRGDMSRYDADYKNKTGFFGRGCTGGMTRGRDATYKVSMDKGDVLDLTYDAPGEAAIWITTDCSKAGDRCVQGQNGSDPEQMTFEAPAKDTYFIIADIDNSGAPLDGEFTLDVHHLGPPACKPGTTSCKTGGSALERCVAPGIGRDYSCKGGCSMGSCGTPQGGICADAVPVNSSTTVSGSFDSTNALSPSGRNTGSCEFGSGGDVPVGSDRIYAVSLTAGQQLSAEYVSGSKSAVMYLMGTCGQAKSCKVTTGAGQSGEITYTAGAAETVYLVVDRTVPGTSTATTYGVEVDIK